MKNLSSQVTVVKSNHDRYRWRVRYPEGGKRKNKYFNIKTEAEAFAVQLRRDIANEGVKSAPMTDAERRAVEVFREHAAEGKGSSTPTLQEAVDYYIQRANLFERSITCQEVADKLLLRIQKEGKGKRHLDDVASRVGRYTALFQV